MRRSRASSRSRSRSRSRGRSASRSRSSARTRSYRGGSPYSSATTFGSYVNGSGNAQFARTFDQSGPYGNVQGGVLIGAQGQNAFRPGTPTAQNLALAQRAGGRRRRHSRRH